MKNSSNLHICGRLLLLVPFVLVLTVAISDQVTKVKSDRRGLDERFAELRRRTTAVVIQLDSAGFRRFVLTSPRNYSMVVMFTVLTNRQRCAECRYAIDEFHVLADSYRSSLADGHRLFFAKLDFDDGSDIFQMLVLSSAPVLMHFPADGEPKPRDTMDTRRFGFAAEALSKWTNSRTGIPIRVIRPRNYFRMFVFGAFVLTICVGLAYFRKDDWNFLYNRTLWAVAALTFCLTMTSGQMWNHIRGAPFLYKSPSTGQLALIHGNTQMQLVVESYIIIILNATSAGGMIVVCESAAALKGDIEKRRFAAIFGLVLFVAAFTVITTVYRLKGHGG